MVRKTVLSAALMSAVLGFGSFGFADEKPAAGGAHAHKDDHKHEHGEVEGVDRKDPKSVAKAVLTAYKNKDLKTLAKLAPEDAAAMINEIAEKGEAHERYKSIFAGWRWDAVQKWDGTTLETRYKLHGDHYDAVVMFGKEGDEVHVVSLHEHDGHWDFMDINSPSADTWAQMSTTKPKVEGKTDGHKH